MNANLAVIPQSQTYMRTIPAELTTQSLSMLDFDQLCRCKEVCKQWKILIDITLEQEVWKRTKFFLRYIDGQVSTFLEKLNGKNWDRALLAFQLGKPSEMPICLMNIQLQNKIPRQNSGSVIARTMKIQHGDLDSEYNAAEIPPARAELNRRNYPQSGGHTTNLEEATMNKSFTRPLFEVEVIIKTKRQVALSRDGEGQDFSYSPIPLASQLEDFYNNTIEPAINNQIDQWVASSKNAAMQKIALGVVVVALAVGISIYRT